MDLGENEEANANIVVKAEDSITTQEQQVVSSLETLLSGAKLDAILCVAGGWAGGSAKSKDFVKNTELMVSQSVNSSVLAARIASLFLNEGGFLTLTGAKAALDPTPGMIGYGLAKAAVHHLTQSLAVEDGGLPSGSSVVSILPVTLDTPMNRKWMPKADTSTWTSLDFISKLLLKWADGDSRPKSGSLVQLITKDGNTDLVIAP